MSHSQQLLIQCPQDMPGPAGIELREVKSSCVVDIIMSRKDSHDIHNKLFDRLFGRLFGESICQWIETRPDKKELYRDLASHMLVKVKESNPDKGQEQQQFTPTCPSTGIFLDEEDSIPDTDSPCKYMEECNSFEPQPSGIGTWVPMFMAEGDMYSMTPDMGLLDEKISKRLLEFPQFLNPNYIFYRLGSFLKIAQTDKHRTFPDMRSAENLVRAWKGKRQSAKTRDIIRIFAAVSCFSHFKRFEEAVVCSQLLGDSHDMSQFFEDCVCAIFAKLDHGSKYSDISIEEHWRRVKNLGENIFALVREFGGLGFLLLFPFHELESVLERRLLAFHSTNTPWKVLGDLLRSTEMGNLFRSMANSIGVPLINMLYGEQNPSMDEMLKRLDAIRLQYSLPRVSYHTPRLAIDTMDKEPASVAFGFCGSLESRHIAPGLSLAPLSLRQFVDGHLQPDVVEYLIRQQLPPDWEVLGKEDISRPATEELLLRDHRGIMIPLCIDDGWILVCYTNPVRSKVDYFIKFINPTWSYERHIAASKMIMNWIPTDAPWVPQELRWQSAQPVDCPKTLEFDSGIHIIIDAIAMAKTGKPESRPLNEQIYDGLRVKYFVHLLNELQEAVNKEAMKNSQENTVVKTGTLCHGYIAGSEVGSQVVRK